MDLIKKMGTLLAKAVAAGVLLASAGLAQAVFTPMGADQVLDTTTNLIWLKNWDLGRGSSFDSADGNTNGGMIWANANSWAASLTIGGVAAGTWRLPTGIGLQAAGSSNEFLQLWTNVGGTDAGLQSKFDGVQAGLYWSGSEFDAIDAWHFGTGIGSQFYGIKAYTLYAVAVRLGDVVPVPEPQSVAMLLMGLMVVGIAVRRRVHP